MPCGFVVVGEGDVADETAGATVLMAGKAANDGIAEALAAR